MNVLMPVLLKLLWIHGLGMYYCHDKYESAVGICELRKEERIGELYCYAYVYVCAGYACSVKVYMCVCGHAVKGKRRQKHAIVGCVELNGKIILI